MAKLKKIVKFLDKYLQTKETEDKSWNGLQIEGKNNVEKIIFAQNASIDIFKKATHEKADLIIVHHGLFWKNRNPSFKNQVKESIEILSKNKTSLYASHLPLDLHKKVGNNAQLLKFVGAEIKEKFGRHNESYISWIGEFKKPISPKEIAKKIKQELNADCKLLLFGSPKIKTIAVCSGGGGYGIYFEALESKVDLYLSGDTVEVYTSAKDEKFNVIFAGHYATETLGVKALMPIIKKKFKINPLFIDDPTGL